MAAFGSTSARPPQLVERLLKDGRGDLLRSELSSATGAEPELVEEALQDACERAVAPGRCRGGSEGEMYAWLRTVALHRVRDLREHARHRHEVLTGWLNEADEPVGDPGADQALLRREKEQELGRLARVAVSHMTERQRDVVALAGRDLQVPQIAERLGTSRRSVARTKAKAYRRAQHALVGAAGGGCAEGERLISRLAFGLAKPAERSDAQLHLTECARCATLHQRLELFHQKIASLLPIPATAQVEPALIERALHKSTQAASELKQQLADSTAHIKQRVSETASQSKQQLADAASHTKQQSAARLAEYSPLAGARPGATASAIAGCLALGGGAAGYCVDQNVNPVTGLVDAIQRPAQADIRTGHPEAAAAQTRAPATTRPATCAGHAPAARATSPPQRQPPNPRRPHHSPPQLQRPSHRRPRRPWAAPKPPRRHQPRPQRPRRRLSRPNPLPPNPDSTSTARE